ncbi:NrdH-redoxin [Zoogloea sp.]|uniref:NrdH-redoxin n=1 Tax=Zoogloea sp. TaxID=49181 RepID=UPI00261BE456|nr:NrdH-redoxin [uncultured Zoogloea sp.]
MPAFGRVLVVLLLALLCLARPGAVLAEEGGAEVQVYLFWSSSCPHCLAARPQVLALAAARPWVVLHDLELGADPAHAERYEAMAAELGEEALAVPALFYCGRMEVGWDEGGGSAARLAQALDACRAGAGTVPQPATLRLPGLGEVDAASLSLPVLTLLVAGMDAFNPCAFFVLLFLLSLLVHQRDRRRMLLIGMLFVVVSGLMYFAFMAAWLGLFLVVGGLPWVTAAAGGVALVIGVINVKDFVAFRQGLSLSIPAGGKADIFQRARAILKADSLPAMLAATLFLAVAANFYELLCTAGFPMVYTRLLSLQVPDRAAQYGWLALYNLVYVLPLTAIVLAFVRTMGARRLGEREGRLLKLLSGLMMLGLGLCLVLAPQALGDPRVALGLLGLAAGLTGLAAWRGR